MPAVAACVPGSCEATGVLPVVYARIVQGPPACCAGVSLAMLKIPCELDLCRGSDYGKGCTHQPSQKQSVISPRYVFASAARV